MKYGIIAAGEGSRLIKDGFSGYKPMAIVDNETLIQRLIRIFTINDADEFFVIINEKERELIDYISNIQHSVPIKIIVKNTESSVHSFFEIVKDNSDVEEICVSTIDAIFNEEEFTEYIKTFRKNKNIDGLMAVTTFIDDDSPLYVELSNDSFITGFSNFLTPANKYSTISGGVYCLRKKAIELVPEALQKGISKMRNYQQELINNNLKIKGFLFSKIIDVDHLADIQKANSFLVSMN
jgi:NDP-sugar pyrophosphorylase family protein